MFKIKTRAGKILTVVDVKYEIENGQQRPSFLVYDPAIYYYKWYEIDPNEEECELLEPEEE